MARLRMKKNVNVKAKDGSWSARYNAGRYYSENHAEFLPDGSFDRVEDRRDMDVFDFDEPDLTDNKIGLDDGTICDYGPDAD